MARIRTLIVPRMIQVTLTRREVVAAKRLAARQQQQDRKAGIVDRRFIDGDITLQGVLAQEGLAKFLGVTPDRTSHVRRGGADILYRGRIGIDVKSVATRIGSTWTIAGHKAAKDSVVFVFAVARVPEPLEAMKVWLAGFLDWDGLQPFRTRNVVENRYAKSAWCYRVRAEDLLPMEDLVPTLDEVLAV